jgi:hypothetical protein
VLHHICLCFPYSALLAIQYSNSIRNIPNEYTGATAIFAGYVSRANISHNTISNTSYSGMTIGWGWGREGSGRGDNHIVANKIEHVQTKRCCDGGGIYTLGPQPGSTLTRNYIHQGNPGSSGNAVYHDNGSGGFTDTDNVIDGDWRTFLLANTPLGNYGPAKICPGPNGEPSDCGLVFTGNWLRTTAGGSKSRTNVSIHDNIPVPTTGALPSGAADVVAQAGVRDGSKWD